MHVHLIAPSETGAEGVDALQETIVRNPQIRPFAFRIMQNTGVDGLALRLSSNSEPDGFRQRLFVVSATTAFDFVRAAVVTIQAQTTSSRVLPIFLISPSPDGLRGSLTGMDWAGVVSVAAVADIWPLIADRVGADGQVLNPRPARSPRASRASSGATEVEIHYCFEADQRACLEALIDGLSSDRAFRPSSYLKIDHDPDGDGSFTLVLIKQMPKATFVRCQQEEQRLASARAAECGARFGGLVVDGDDV